MVWKIQGSRNGSNNKLTFVVTTGVASTLMSLVTRGEKELLTSLSLQGGRYTSSQIPSKLF